MARQAKPQQSRSPARITPVARTATAENAPENDQPAKDFHATGRPFPIVGLGASAGGLEALELFLSQVPVASGMAFVVVQHLDPTHQGMLPELLQRVTMMPVTQARNRLKVKPDCVYVIPPNKNLSILRGCLHLLDPVETRGLRLPIDYFFRALADDCREQAIGVILSGMGSDGTLGLKAIKEVGGLVFAQDPASAGFDSMPRSAISTGLVDVVVTPEEMPSRLLEFLSHPGLAASRAELAETGSVTEKSSFEKICILLRARTGHDFSLYKKSTLYRRIERRMAIHQVDHIADYVKYLNENLQEVDLLFRELLIGVTSFFRDPAVWASLQEQGLPGLFAAYPEGGCLRAWVAGCSTGEEAYSLAICFKEAQEKLRLPGRYSLQIFATDLDSDAVDKARAGFYPANIAADVSEERLKRYFINDGGRYRISKEIREMVVFAPHDIIMDPPFTKLDILTCRNLLIYLGSELQMKLLPLFHYSLKPNGVLLLGSAESVGGYTELFSPLDGKSKLFLRLPGQPSVNQLDFPTRYFPPNSEPAMQNKPDSPPANLQSIADQMLLQQFSPAAVLVNAEGDLLYISGRTGNYIEPAAGKANWNIHAMARDGLRQEIAIGLPKALRSGETVVHKHVPVGSNGSTRLVDLTIKPVLQAEGSRAMALVVFTDVDAPPQHIKPITRGKDSAGSRQIAELEQALALAQQELKALREEKQTAHEELKSANEELQSTNEELQSTNEELTTSKEEMQSLNEELQSVNVELQSKLDELCAANNDMKNLLNSTDVATIFLDNALHLRRFTNQVTKLFKLIPGDIGRPLSDIVNDLVYPDLLNDAEEVLRSLVFSDKEIKTKDGRWFQVKIMPYRTLENLIDGVVITFNDIGRAKLLEAELRAIANTKGDGHDA